MRGLAPLAVGLGVAVAAIGGGGDVAGLEEAGEVGFGFRGQVRVGAEREPVSGGKGGGRGRPGSGRLGRNPERTSTEAGYPGAEQQEAGQRKGERSGLKTGHWQTKGKAPATRDQPFHRPLYAYAPICPFLSLAESRCGGETCILTPPM